MIDKNILTKEIIQIVAEIAGMDKDNITLDSNLKNDLGLDSLDTIDLIMDLENKYNISIYDDNAIDQTFTIKDVIDLIIMEYEETENVKKKRNNKSKSTKT